MCNVLFSFWVILEHPAQTRCCRSRYMLVGEERESIFPAGDLRVTLSIPQKLKIIPSLFKYMTPVALVYVAEYVINQGLVSYTVFSSACSYYQFFFS